MKNSTTRILTIAVILLLLVNGTMLYFMLNKRGGDKRPDRRGGMESVMAKELNMSEQQQADYKKMKEEHFNSVRPLFDSLRVAKQAFFNLAKDSVANDSLAEVYSNKVASIQKMADKQMLEHFRKVRNMFSGDQQKKFDEFMAKMMQGRKRDSSNKRKPE